jgi:4-amino-4-deoxy-L-arabinose transferase-like glycosyltransferase
VLLLVGLLVALSFFRLWDLDLDPPTVVVPGYGDQAHYRDEAAKAHEARNMAKWGQWSLSEYDEYEFWRAQSPAWVWGEYAWFRLFGVGVVEARAFVVVHTIVALALLMWLALIRHGLPTALVTGSLLGLNWGYLIYSRLALMEGALLCWLLVATVALSQLERRPHESARWTALAVLAMLVACTIKQTGLLLVPAFVLALLLLAMRNSGGFRAEAVALGWKRRLGESLAHRETRLALVGVTLLSLVLAYLLFNPEYQERLAFNAQHFTASYEQPVLQKAARMVVRGFFSRRLQLMFFTFAPIILWLGTLELARILYVAWLRKRARAQGGTVPETGLFARPDPIDLWMLAWGLLGLFANLASPHRAIRFQLVMLPPAAWLAGVFVARVWAHAFVRPRVTAAVRGALVTLALVGVTTTVVRFVSFCVAGRNSATQIGEQLEALIGDRHAVVIGEFAAQAVFETDYWHFYVRPYQFNTSDEILDALGATHLVAWEEDFVEEYLWDKRPDLLTGRRKLGEIEFRGEQLTVWELRPPDAPAPVKVEVPPTARIQP